MARRASDLDDWQHVPSDNRKPPRIANAGRLVAAVDVEIRAAVDGMKGHGPGFYNWWNQLSFLVGEFVITHDYAHATALVDHLACRLRLRRSVRPYVASDALETAVVSWTAHTRRPQMLRSGNCPLGKDLIPSIDLSLGNLVGVFRRDIEHAITIEAIEAMRGHMAANYRDDVNGDQAGENDPNLMTDAEADAEAFGTTAHADEPAIPSDPRVAQVHTLRARLERLRLRGDARRIADLILDNSALSEPEIARRLGISERQIRRVLRGLSRKLAQI